MLITLQSRAMPRHFKAVRFEASRNYHAIQSYRKIMEGRFYNKCKGPFAGENRSATQEALIPPGLFQSPCIKLAYTIAHSRTTKSAMKHIATMVAVSLRLQKRPG